MGHLGNYKDEMRKASDEGKMEDWPQASFCTTLIWGPTEKHKWLCTSVNTVLDGNSHDLGKRCCESSNFKYAVMFMVGHRGELMV